MKIVIDTPNHVKNRLIFGTTYKDDLRIMVEALEKSTPLIERPKGNWIDICVIKAFHYDGEPRVRCSRCGNEEEWSSNYCPNCGAEMDGGGEGEET